MLSQLTTATHGSTHHFPVLKQMDYIWGRGAQDNKSGVIAILEAVERLVKEGYQPTRTLWLVFGHDEETDGRNGAGKIAAYLEAKNIKLETVLDEGLFVSEGLFPGLLQPLALIGVAEKGYLTVDLHFKGEGGHSSVPPLNSSIARMGEFAHRLEQKKDSTDDDRTNARSYSNFGPDDASTAALRHE